VALTQLFNVFCGFAGPFWKRITCLASQGAVRVLLDARATPDVADKPMDETPLMEELLGAAGPAGWWR